MMMQYTCFSLIFLFSTNAVIPTVLSLGNFRILSGNYIDAKAGELPWFTAIEVARPNGKDICAGNILNNEWILTAATCVKSITSAKIYPGRINMGLTPAVTYESEEFHIHPHFNLETYDADLGLIKLKAKLCFNEFVQPIKLADHKLEDKTVVTVPGWGWNPNTSKINSQELHYLELAVIPNEECTEAYGSDTPDSNFCTTSGPNHKSCNSNSGAGATAYYNGETRLVGIHAYIAENCKVNYPMGFIRTYTYLDWIKNITGL